GRKPQLKMRTVALLLTLIASQLSSAQPPSPSVDPRWTLTVPDSMVHGPYSDFRLMAANRLVTDQNVRALLWEKHAWQGIADKERERGDSLAVALDLTKLAGGKLVEGNMELRQNLMDCGGRNARLQGWA